MTILSFSELVESPEGIGEHVDPFVQLRDGRLSAGSNIDSCLSASLDTAPEFVNLATLFIASRQKLKVFEAEAMAKLIQLNSPLAIRFAVEVLIERQRQQDALSLLRIRRFIPTTCNRSRACKFIDDCAWATALRFSPGPGCQVLG